MESFSLITSQSQLGALSAELYGALMEVALAQWAGSSLLERMAQCVRRVVIPVELEEFECKAESRTMKLVDILKIAYPQFDESDCKVHLAVTSPSGEDPLTVFFSGGFMKWQETQTRKNFEKTYILSLIQLPEKRNHWLFAGVYKTIGCESYNEGETLRYRYSTQPLEDKMFLIGRLVINFERPSRQSYLVFENWKDRFQVAELRAKPMAVIDFPGHENVRIKSLIHLVLN